MKEIFFRQRTECCALSAYVLSSGCAEIRALSFRSTSQGLMRPVVEEAQADRLCIEHIGKRNSCTLPSSTEKTECLREMNVKQHREQQMEERHLRQKVFVDIHVPLPKQIGHVVVFESSVGLRRAIPHFFHVESAVIPTAVGV